MTSYLLRRHLFSLLVITLSLLLAALLSAGIIKKTTYSATEKSLHQSALMISNLLSVAADQELDELLKTLKVEGLRITIIRSDGEVIADSEADIRLLDNHKNREEVSEAGTGKLGLATRFSQSVSRNLLYLALPIKNISGMDLIIRTSAAVDDINSILKKAYSKIAIIAFSILFILLLISMLIEKRMARPLFKIQKAAAAFASGNLDYYLHISHPEDIKAVAKSLNKMATTLSNKITTITMQKNELHTILGGMVEAVILFNNRGIILNMNSAACRLFSVAKEKAQGSTFLDAVRDSRLYSISEKIFEQEEAIVEQIELSAQQLKPVNLDIYCTLLPNAGHKEQRAIIVINDITELKRLGNIRTDFVANVSHELKTPVTAIKGFLETIIEGDTDQSTAEHFLTRSLKNTNRLDAIINDLLSLSKLENSVPGKDEFLESSIDEIVANAIQACTAKANKKKITIDYYNKRDFKIRVIPNLIEQALINLIDNALKYSDPGTKVCVKLEDHKTELKILVKDEGKGIPVSEQERIFERFYRVDKARSRESGGTGLGLSIVKHICELHDGKVSVLSEEEKGSAFSITLPKNHSA